MILAVRGEGGATSEVSLAHISRAGNAEVAMLGLRLSEGKQVVARLQHEIVMREFAATTQRLCSEGSLRRRIACCITARSSEKLDRADAVQSQTQGRS